MADTLTHELIHSYDYCRAHVDWSDDKHLACSEIRAASLSGECFFWKENFARLKFGWKKHHQASKRFRSVVVIRCLYTRCVRGNEQPNPFCVSGT